MVGIYKITNLTTGNYYIGQSKDIVKRWNDHFCKGYGAMHSPLFTMDIDMYGRDGFSFEVIEECPVESLLEREAYYIEKLKPKYNSVFKGHEVSTETRRKISKSLTGKKQPPEVVKKRGASLSAYLKEHPRSNERHYKKCAAEVDSRIVGFESVKAMAAFFKVCNATATKALKRNGRIKKCKVWYVV